MGERYDVSAQGAETHHAVTQVLRGAQGAEGIFSEIFFFQN